MNKEKNKTGRQVVDLHMHSTASDGTLSPADVIRMCAAAGLQTVALTDHDTVAGVKEAIATGREVGVRVIVGSELSVTHNDHEFHMLSYGFDPGNGPLVNRLADFRQSREDRAFKVALKLQEFGFDIRLEDFERSADGAPIGKPHMARAVMENPKNNGLLEQHDVETSSDFIMKFLSDTGLAFVPRDKLPAREAISLVHAAGGVCVLAHPGWTFRRNFASAVSFLEELKSYGLDGVEVFYLGHSKDQTEQLRIAVPANLTAHQDLTGGHPAFQTVGDMILANGKPVSLVGEGLVQRLEDQVDPAKLAQKYRSVARAFLHDEGNPKSWAARCNSAILQVKKVIPLYRVACDLLPRAYHMEQTGQFTGGLSAQELAENAGLGEVFQAIRSILDRQDATDAELWAIAISIQTDAK